MSVLFDLDHSVKNSNSMPSRIAHCKNGSKYRIKAADTDGSTRSQLICN